MNEYGEEFVVVEIDVVEVSDEIFYFNVLIMKLCKKYDIFLYNEIWKEECVMKVVSFI